MAGLEKITDRYKFKKEIGRGAYGAVWSAKETETGREVAIKRVGARNFEEQILTKRAFRELKLLRHMNGHENVHALILPCQNPVSLIHYMETLDYTICGCQCERQDVSLHGTVRYIVESLMEADLNQIIKSGQVLTNQHYQFFVYQILRGLKWMHSSNILHRDLKPGNLLVNSDCELRICDFGLARGVDEVDSHLVNTEYVATRYYRAPEVVLSPKHYQKPIDIWSVGCIFGELLISRILFKGADYVDQLYKIFDVLGTPTDPSLMRLCSPRVLKYIKSWAVRPKMDLRLLFTKADASAIDLIDKMLTFDPNERINAEGALSHPYLSLYHFPDDEPVNPKIFDFSFENIKDIDEVKKLVVAEINDMKSGQSKPQQNSVNKDVTTARKQSMSSGKSLSSTSNFSSIPKIVDEPLAQGRPTNIEEELRLHELELGS